MQSQQPPQQGQRIQITPQMAQQMAAQMRQQQQQQQMSSPPPPAISPSEVDFEEQPVTSKGKVVEPLKDASDKVKDVADSINYLIKKLEQHPEYAVPPPPSIMKPTRTQQFNKAKEDGNAKFKEGDLDEALKLFTVAVDLAADRPPWESHVLAREELSLALSNRSLAYHNKGEFIKSLADADAVVQIKRPWSKGHFRKGKALMALDRHEEARDAILLGLEFEPSNEDLKKALSDVDTIIIVKHHQKQGTLPVKSSDKTSEEDNDEKDEPAKQNS